MKSHYISDCVARKLKQNQCELTSNKLKQITENIQLRMKSIIWLKSLCCVRSEQTILPIKVYTKQHFMLCNLSRRFYSKMEPDLKAGAGLLCVCVWERDSCCARSWGAIIS